MRDEEIQEEGFNPSAFRQILFQKWTKPVFLRPLIPPTFISNQRRHPARELILYREASHQFIPEMLAGRWQRCLLGEGAGSRWSAHPGVLFNPGQLLGARVAQLAPDTLLQPKRVGRVLAAGMMCFAFTAFQKSVPGSNQSKVWAQSLSSALPCMLGKTKIPLSISVAPRSGLPLGLCAMRWVLWLWMARCALWQGSFASTLWKSAA